jgi:hypothetical protein
MRLKLAAAVIAALTFWGCGDPETTDDRGYTKSPLERPGLTIEGGEEYNMRAFGRPNLPVARDIDLADTEPQPAATTPPANQGS